jgi:hypothetical protein
MIDADPLGIAALEPVRDPHRVPLALAPTAQKALIPAAWCQLIPDEGCCVNPERVRGPDKRG